MVKVRFASCYKFLWYTEHFYRRVRYIFAEGEPSWRFPREMVECYEHRKTEVVTSLLDVETNSEEWLNLKA